MMGYHGTKVSPFRGRNPVCSNYQGNVFIRHKRHENKLVENIDWDRRKKEFFKEVRKGDVILRKPLKR